MRPQADPWRDLKQWLWKRLLGCALLMTLYWGVVVLLSGSPFPPLQGLLQAWLILLICAPVLPLLLLRTGRCRFSCPRCSRRFFGWKPQSRLRYRRILQCAVAHLARGPIKRKRKGHLRECAYCGLPLFARIRYVSTQDIVPL
jgi:hypothetical protein